jgi:hypothetical protein
MIEILCAEALMTIYSQGERVSLSVDSCIASKKELYIRQSQLCPPGLEKNTSVSSLADVVARSLDMVLGARA